MEWEGWREGKKVRKEGNQFVLFSLPTVMYFPFSEIKNIHKR